MSSNNEETLVIPETLLELQGLSNERKATADAAMRVVKLASEGKIDEANRLITAERLVEAGWGSFLKNLFRKTLKPQEIESLFHVPPGIAPQNMPTGQSEYLDIMTNYLRNLAKTNPNGPSVWNRGIPTKFVRTEMTPELQRIDEIIKANPQLSQAHVDEILTLMGGAGKNATEAITSPMSIFKNIKNRISGGDTVLKQNLPGIEEMTQQGGRNPVSLEKFLLQGSSIGQPNSGIVITNPSALNHHLESVAQDLATKAGNRQIAEAFKMTTGALIAGWAIGVPLAAINTMRNVSPSGQSFDNTGKILGPGGMHIDPLKSNPVVNNPLDPYQKQNSDQEQNSNQNSPLGGTTNGNNFGNFGGQFNQPWSPPAPNLPNNPNDWLPTKTTNYYDAFKKSDVSDSNIRLASDTKQMLMNLPSIDDVITHFVTILEQGEPNEATLKSAADYLQSVYKEGEPILMSYQENPLLFAQSSQEKVNPQEK